MYKNIMKEVFLIINCHHLCIIKEIKEELLKYGIYLNIYKKDDDFKKLLATDTIVILDDELLLDYGYLKKIEKLISMKRAVHLFKYKSVDLSNLKLFFKMDNSDISTYLENNNDFLFQLITSLKVFKIKFHYLNSSIDKHYSKDVNFISLLEYYLKEEIKDKNKLKELLPISTKELNNYFNVIDKLLISKFTIIQIREFLPFIYHQVYKKNKYELKLNMVINEIYYDKNYLSTILCCVTQDEFNNQYNDYLNAVEKRIVIDNLFIKILNKLEVIRIVDGEIRNVLSEKDINSIKLFLENKFIKKEVHEKVDIVDRIFLNYVDDIRIRNFNDFHKIKKLNILKDITDADIVITLITKKSLQDRTFINNIKVSVELNKKLLFVYLDRCELNISLQYLIGFSDNMCYWAYKRIDTFFEKYLEKIEYIANNELKENRSNIVKLR